MEPQIDFDKVRETAIDISETFAKVSCKNTMHLINSRQDELDGIFQLAIFTIDRIDTLLSLVKTGKLWDAEIIFRTVLEVFMKFLYVIRQKSPEATKEKLDEYWIHLSEIEKFKLSYEASQLINTKSVKDPERFQHMVLSDEERASLEAKYSKDERRRIDQNWSFSKLHMDVMKNKDVKNLLSIETIHYFWKMSSHIAHGHKFGVNSVIQRSTIKELRPYNDLTQLIKLVKASTLVCIWVYLEIAEKLNDDDAYNTAAAMSNEYSAYMRNNYSDLDDESQKAEDEFLKRKFE